MCIFFITYTYRYNVGNVILLFRHLHIAYTDTLHYHITRVFLMIDNKLEIVLYFNEFEIVYQIFRVRKKKKYLCVGKYTYDCLLSRNT